MKTTKTVLVTLLAGSAGALLGILLAPDKGADTRRKIISKSGEFTDGLKDKYSEFVDGLKQKGDQLHQDAEDQLAKGKKKFEEAKKSVEYTAM